MKLLKALQFLFLSYLICLLTSANFSDFAREKPVTTLVQNPESEVSSSREDLFPNSWQPVAVQCGEDEMMIQVHRDLFQTGHFIQAKDLSIGPQSCHYFIVNESATLIVFKVELHECIQNLQVLDLMLYNVSLYYKPMSNLTTVKSAEKFPITCHYSWKNDASSNAIQTTRVLFTSAMSEKGKQYFSLRLMTAVVDISKGEMEADLVVGPALIQKAAGNHERDQIGVEEEMLAEGQEASVFPVIEAGTDYEIGQEFIVKADKEVRWILLPNRTMKEVMDMVRNDKSDDIHSGGGDLNIEISPVEVTMMTSQGNAPMKGTILGQILTTATGILFFFSV